MLIKKSFFVLMFSLFIVSSSFAGIKNIDNGLWNEEEDVSVGKNNKIKSGTDFDKYYINAKNAYWMDDMTTANMYLDAILTVGEDQKASELKNKIILMEEKKAFFKKNIVNNYSMELNRLLKDMNFYEGYLVLNRMTALSPDADLSYANARLKDEVDNVSKYLDSDEDKNMFKSSIDDFSKENFRKANTCIKKLSKKYPKFLMFKGISESYSLDEDNNKAVKKYYDKALNAVKAGDMYKAKYYIDLAYSIRNNDVDILVLMEKINMEFM